MEIKSRGLQSEFIFHDMEAITTDHGDYLSVLTPDNLEYFYGNFLLYPAPPKAGDIDAWRDRFAEVFDLYPAVRHETFQWLPTGSADPEALVEFRQAGFRVDEVSVLSATTVHTDKPPPEGVSFRPITTGAEWLAVTDAQSAEGFPGIPVEEFRRYKDAMFANYRRMAEQGLGDWWGAFKGDTLVADMGLFFGKGVGRFQSVETAPEHRRQGICRAMVYYVSKQGFAAHPGISLILHAEAGEVAREIYRSVGYEEIEVLQSVFRPPTTL